MRSEDMTRIYRRRSAKYEKIGGETYANFEASPWDEVSLYAIYDSSEF